MASLGHEELNAGAMTYLALVKKLPHAEAVEKTVSRMIETLGLDPEGAAELRAEIEQRASVHVALPVVMPGDDAHVEWFDATKKTGWQRWIRYRRYLLEEKRWPFDSVARLDEATDLLTSQLEDPTVKDRPFDRRGLVVGYVQSGKTGNYMGLMCKALDAGYKVVVVLTGMHNSLRHQTQIRIDEEVLGVTTAFDPGGRQAIGVGLLPGAAGIAHQYLTAQGETGDFNSQIASKVGVHVGATPLLLVIKKNVTVLDNLVRYFANGSTAKKSADGRPVVPDCPLLLIDDEADQASVNFKSMRDDDDRLDPEADPSRINELIRQLLMTFTQRAYVGYTATPFANIYIHNNAAHPQLGPDLFPRSFIITLPPPSDYVGPKEVFGLGPPKNPDDPMEHAEGQPVVRVVDDYDDLAPDSHKVDWVPRALPPSLREAVMAFLLSAAIRRCRGQGTRHHSMLVHVTRFTGVQKRVGELVQGLVSRLKSILQYRTGSASTADSYPAVIGEFRKLWDRDFVQTSKQMSTALPNWADVEREITPAALKVVIKTINGDVGDVLDYERNKDAGVSIIAIGGDKLSRGLTLEGLTVSYYLRASKMYDTLMQMGRWFGYRPNYADVCRIYTTEELVEWFQHIARATEELRAEFETMQKLGATPKEFGLRVQSHPTMLVTSPLKMREGEKIAISYDGTVSETILFDVRPQTLQANRDQAEILVKSLGAPTRRAAKDRGSYLWDGVAAQPIIGFLDAYQSHPGAPRANTRRMAQYVKRMNARGELTTWTVALITSSQKPVCGEDTLAGLPLVLLKRNAFGKPTAHQVAIRRLLSPSDELLDLTPAEEQGLKQYLTNPENPTGKIAADDARGYDVLKPTPRRVGRPNTRGLLLIYPLGAKGFEVEPLPMQNVFGVGVSFPRSVRAEKVEYVVNPVWIQREFGSDTAG